MTEIAIVLAIVGLILGAVWVAAKAVMDSNRANQAVQDITTIANNVRSTFAATNNFTSAGGADQTATFITAGILPSNLLSTVGGVTSAKNEWNGAVKIYTNLTANTNNVSYQASRVFRVSFYRVPVNACFRIISQLANLGTVDGPITLITATGGYAKNINNGDGTTPSLSTDTINTACAQNTPGNESVEFEYTIH